MKIEFTGDRPRDVVVGVRTLRVSKGDAVDVPDDDAKSLIDQGWFKPVKESKAKSEKGDD